MEDSNGLYGIEVKNTEVQTDFGIDSDGDDGRESTSLGSDSSGKMELGHISSLDPTTTMVSTRRTSTATAPTRRAPTTESAEEQGIHRAGITMCQTAGLTETEGAPASALIGLALAGLRDVMKSVWRECEGSSGFNLF